MSEVTDLLAVWRHGDVSALDHLIPIVYDDLRRLAHSLSANSSNATRGTALVHDLYLRLAGQTHPDIQNRAHFFAVASRAMRQILVDRSRRLLAQRRGAGAPASPIDDLQIAAVSPSTELLELDDALHRLAALHPRRAQVIELRYFGGLGAEEAAEALGVSSETIRRESRLAEAWLGELLNPS